MATVVEIQRTMIIWDIYDENKFIVLDHRDRYRSNEKY
jgi:hypothetical protein